MGWLRRLICGPGQLPPRTPPPVPEPSLSPEHEQNDVEDRLRALALRAALAQREKHE